MRVLVVSNVQTHPHNAGNSQGVFRECRKMKELGWEVDFLFWGWPGSINVSDTEEFFGENYFINASYTTSDIWNEFISFCRLKLDKIGITKYIPFYYKADELYRSELKDKIIRMHSEKHYDVIWLEYYLQSKVFDFLDEKVVKVIHTHDRFANRNRIFQKDGKVPEFYYLTKKGERKALSRADIVIAVQDSERILFEKTVKGTNTLCITVGNFIEIQETLFVENNNFGFLGSVNDANIDSAKLLVNDYIPEIMKRNSKCRFILAGGVCNTEGIQNGEYENMGSVEAVEQFYNSVSFVVTPMLAGTGLNIKNIEALSYGKPIITTSIGAKGLSGASEAIIIADTKEEFVEATLRLVSDKTLLKKMSDAAYRYVVGYNHKNEEKYHQIEKIVLERKSNR